MTLKLISTATLLGLMLASCNPTKAIKETTTSNNHNSQNSLDWQGTYYGVTPCASCEGIETELTLTNDSNYVLTTTYMGKENTPNVTKGKFTWQGNNIKLEGIDKDKSPTMYKIEEGKIKQLDMKGKEITGDLSNRYALTKNGNSEVEDKRWKLIELYGKPIKGSAETHYVIFHSKDGRLEAKANCNMMNNNYKIRNNYRLTIQSGISTLMACPDNLEQEFSKALAQADNLSVGGNNLSINKGRMAPLARFELVP